MYQLIAALRQMSRITTVRCFIKFPVQTFLIFLSPSVLTKSGPLGDWRRAKTEVSLRANRFHFISSTGSEEKTQTVFFMILFFRISHQETSEKRLQNVSCVVKCENWRRDEKTVCWDSVEIFNISPTCLHVSCT